MSVVGVRVLPQPAGPFRLRLQCGSTYTFEPFVQVHPDGEDNLGNCIVMDIVDHNNGGNLERVYKSLWREPRMGGACPFFSGNTLTMPASAKRTLQVPVWYDESGLDLLQYPYILGADQKEHFLQDQRVYPRYITWASIESLSYP